MWPGEKKGLGLSELDDVGESFVALGRKGTLAALMHMMRMRNSSVRWHRPLLKRDL